MSKSSQHAHASHINLIKNTCKDNGISPQPYIDRYYDGVSLGEVIEQVINEAARRIVEEE
jgi:hypothetical protein